LGTMSAPTIVNHQATPQLSIVNCQLPEGQP
jgi:hypothetical protein